MHYPEPISKLIDSFMKLPGIGPKTAQRLAFHTLDMKEDDVVQFAKSLVDVKRERIVAFVVISLKMTLAICEDKQRDRSVVCVVEDDKDVIAMEKCASTKVYIMCYMVRYRQWMALDLKILIFQR